MSAIIVEAVYEKGVFRPLASVDVQEGQHVSLSLLDIEEGTPTPDIITTSSELQGSSFSENMPDPQRVYEELARISALPIEPSDEVFSGWEHDRILYGSPNGAR